MRLVTAILLATLVHSAGAQQPDVVFVPTPQEVVDRMLEMAKVGKGDVLYDLGSGDGRIPVTAAKRFGIRAVGIDIDPQRIAEATENVRKAGVQDRVTLIRGDIFDPAIKINEASVVTLYLLPALNLKLRPRLWSELKPGTRVVSNSFDMGQDWPAEKTEMVENYTIYFWTIKPR